MNQEFDGRLQTLNFMNCYFSSGFWPNDPLFASQQCVNEIFGDIWPTIDFCSRSKEGEELYARLRVKVDALIPPMISTPWITINGKYSFAAHYNLKRAICDAFTVRNIQCMNF